MGLRTSITIGVLVSTSVACGAGENAQEPKDSAVVTRGPTKPPKSSPGGGTKDDAGSPHDASLETTFAGTWEVERRSEPLYCAFYPQGSLVTDTWVITIDGPEVKVHASSSRWPIESYVGDIDGLGVWLEGEALEHSTQFTLLWDGVDRFEGVETSEYTHRGFDCEAERSVVGLSVRAAD